MKADSTIRIADVRHRGMSLESKVKFGSRKLLLMGSSAFRSRELPIEVRRRIDEAMESGVTIVVGEAHGASRLYQDYLKSRGYRKVVVGHAIRLRYNADNWKNLQYGKNLKERERRMIEDCDSAVVIWMNKSGVIAENLELLKRTSKPTFLYECSDETDEVIAGELDPNRIYDSFYYMHERRRKQGAALQRR
jgi:hypothetical protein